MIELVTPLPILAAAFVIGAALGYLAERYYRNSRPNVRVYRTPDDDPRTKCARCGQHSRRSLCDDCRDEAETHT